MTHEPDRFRHDDSFRESHASDGTAFGHVGQPSTPIDDEIERGTAPTWPILAIRYIRGDEEVVRAVNRFVDARTKWRELDEEMQMQSPLEDSIIAVQGKYAAARSALDKMANRLTKVASTLECVKREQRESQLYWARWDVDWQRKYVVEQVAELHRREERLKELEK
jgi:hypothetical protein